VPPPRQPHGYPPPGYPAYVLAPPPVSPAGQPLASFIDRLLAYLIDGALATGVMTALMVPAFIILFMTIGPDLFQVRPDGTPVQPDFIEVFVPVLLFEASMFLVMLLLYYVYYVEVMFRSGQTVGKKVMKIKVAPVDPAATLGRGFAAKRFLVQFVGGSLVPGLGAVDGLWQLWDKPYQQCLHDKFAKTLVVKVPA